MARTVRSAGIPAGAWFARQSFHSSTETQPRLEGAGADRIVATPTFAAPFALTAEADTTPDATPRDLFSDRAAFHALITAPTTGARLDAMLEDNRATDARILAERDAELEAEWDAERAGDACGPACGYCGRCS
jgi:hypothetical protein